MLDSKLERMEHHSKEEDIVVRIVPPADATRSEALLVFPFHSHVLCARSSFFAARLSQRWNSAEPNSTSAKDTSFDVVDIIAIDSSAAVTYKRCMDLMYVQREDMITYRSFLGVDDALSMLHIASNLLFEDCMDACTEYLSMLPSWTCAEEKSIRTTLTSLQLMSHMHMDLARRLSLPQAVPLSEPTLVLRGMLVHLLQACTSNEHIPEVKHLDPSEPIPQSIICLAWNTLWRLTMLNFHKKMYSVANSMTSTLCWLFDELLAFQAADAVLKTFALDTDSSRSIAACLNNVHAGASSSYMRFVAGMCDLLACMMQSVEHGQVLLSHATRLNLIKTWLPVCDTRYNDRRHEMMTSMVNLISSLPIVDRGEAYKYCMDCLFRGPIELRSSIFPWYKMLREVHAQLNGGSGIAIVSSVEEAALYL